MQRDRRDNGSVLGSTGFFFRISSDDDVLMAWAPQAIQAPSLLNLKTDCLMRFLDRVTINTTYAPLDSMLFVSFEGVSAWDSATYNNLADSTRFIYRTTVFSNAETRLKLVDLPNYSLSNAKTRLKLRSMKFFLWIPPRQGKTSPRLKTGRITLDAHHNQ